MPPTKPFRLPRLTFTLALLIPWAFASVAAYRAAGRTRPILSRANATVMLEPYAPNVVRVTLSLRRPDAIAAPGYGISAKPSSTGWHSSTSDAGDILSSARITVTVSPDSSRASPGSPPAPRPTSPNSSAAPPPASASTSAPPTASPSST